MSAHCDEFYIRFCTFGIIFFLSYSGNILYLIAFSNLVPTVSCLNIKPIMYKIVCLQNQDYTQELTVLLERISTS